MLGDPLTPDEEAAARRALKLALKLTEDFNANHPAKAAASKFVDTLFKAGPPVGAPTTRRDREIKRAADELHVPFYAIYDLFDGEPSALEEFIFGNLLRIVKAAYALGQHAAPDGRNARQARRDRADTNFSTLVRTLVLYLNAYRLEPKLGAKFAGQIRPAIVDALGLPEGTAWPSSSTIVKALRAIKKEV